MARPGTSPGDTAGIVFAVALFGLFFVTPEAAARSAPAIPVIDLVMASRSTVFTSEPTEVLCVARHDDGAPLTYLWSSDSGTLIPSGDSAIWVAPEQEGTYSVSIQVVDDAGSLAYDSVSITAVQNQPPVVVAITAVPDTLLPGESATLTCEANDPEGHAITCEWMGPSGIIAGSGPTVTWTAPDRPGQHHVVIRVTDEMGASRTRNVLVNVQCLEPPVINEMLVFPVLPDYTTSDVDGGYRLLRGSLTECEIQCVAVTPYDDLTYEWSSTEGSIAGKGPIVMFTPPNDTTQVIVTVTVSDVCGQSDSASLSFKVFQREEYSTVVDSLPGCMRCLQNH